MSYKIRVEDEDGEFEEVSNYQTVRKAIADAVALATLDISRSSPGRWEVLNNQEEVIAYRSGQTINLRGEKTRGANEFDFG